MIATSVLVAGLVQQHEWHDRARPAVAAAARGAVPGIVLAEAWSVLRRSPFELSAEVVAAALAPWREEDRVLATPASLSLRALQDGPFLQLGGNVHDYLALLTCEWHGTGLATLDRRQAPMASHLDVLDVELVPPPAS